MISITDKTLQDLEFTTVLQTISERCNTEIGRQKALEIVPFKEFFDYEAKYEGASEEITPARIDDETRKRVEEIAKKAYDSLGMSGFSRSEFIIMSGIPYMLEMNTNPGFSPASILPQQAAIYGISIKDLCGNEVEKAFLKNK